MGDDGSDDEGYLQLMGRLREMGGERSVVHISELELLPSEDDAESDRD